MKKIATIILLVLMPLSFLFSIDFDWGGAFQNSTDVSGINDTSVSQINSLSFWAEIDVNPLLNFKVGAGYRFSYDGDVSHIPEFGTLYAYGSIDEISYKAGRFNFDDINGNLFSTIMDGGEFNYRSETMRFSSGIGFSGLIFNDNSNISMTTSDYDLKLSDSIKLASPRLAEYAEAVFYVLPHDGSVSVALLAQQDLLSDSSLESGEGLLHSFYLNAGLKGRLLDFVFYNFYLTGELGIYDMVEDDRSLVLGAAAGGLKIDIPLQHSLNPLVSFELYYSSGDDWGRTDFQGSSINSDKNYLNQFTPFSMQKKGYVYSMNGGNLIYGDISFSISPLSFISIALESLTLFRAVDGPVSTLPVTVTDSSSSLFLGEELTIAVNLRPLSDLGFQVKGGVFIPNDAVVADGVQYKFGAYMSLSF